MCVLLEEKTARRIYKMIIYGKDLIFYDISSYNVTEVITAMKGRIRFTEHLTDELVKNVDRFSSLVCLLRDCYGYLNVPKKLALKAYICITFGRPTMGKHSII